MKLIKQRNGVDCGIAVAAMVSGMDYEYASEADPSPNKTTGFCPADLIYTLEGLTGEPFKESRRGYRQPLAAYSKLPQTGAILIRDPRKTFGHWIATDQGKVFDPELNTVTNLTEYSRNQWLIIRIVEKL